MLQEKNIFKVPALKERKILICCCCLEKNIFFKILFLFLFRILTSFVKVLPKPYFLLPKCWSFNASCKQVVKLCAIKMSVASLSKHRIYEIQKKNNAKIVILLWSLTRACQEWNEGSSAFSIFEFLCTIYKWAPLLTCIGLGLTRVGFCMGKFPKKFFTLALQKKNDYFWAPWPRKYFNNVSYAFLLKAKCIWVDCTWI